MDKEKVWSIKTYLLEGEAVDMFPEVLPCYVEVLLTHAPELEPRIEKPYRKEQVLEVVEAALNPHGKLPEIERQSD